MLHCPKCGSYRISGPFYERNRDGYDALRYRCDNCGYSQTTPTLDRATPNPKQEGGQG